MILQALYRLAHREGLLEDPDYEPKPVAWLVRIGKDGRMLGIQGTHHIPPGEENRKKPKSVPKRFNVPREKPVTSGDRAFLLFNKSEYVFGLDPEKQRPKDKLETRFRLFKEKVRECADATADEGVRAVHVFLEDLAAGRQAVSLPADCAPNDLFAFVFADDECLVSDRDKVRAYWKAMREIGAGMEGADNDTPHCLVSGAPCGLIDNFPTLKKVPGGTTSGVALVSFNKNAFESYGWKGNDNAPISRGAAEACGTALNRLLDTAYPDPKHPGQTLPHRSLRLSRDTAVCFWSAEKSGDEFCGIFGGLLKADPSNVREVYHSIWRGKCPEVENPSDFYALIISGSQGRAIVRDWFETSVAEAVRNLCIYFEDLDIVRNAPRSKDHDQPPHIPMSTLLESLSPQGASEKIPADLIPQLVRGALRGTPYPFSILQRALERVRAEIGSEGKDGLEGYQAKQRADARAALIKAFLNRRKRFHPKTTSYEEVQPDMDPNHSSQGYALGRLMAVLERIQQEAIGNVNASIVDRYFSGASAAPKSVFVRLLKNARHHVSKAKDDPARGGIVFLLDKLVDELADRFDPKHNGFPSHLDLEQQGLFVLGYHQMRRWLWMNKEERAEWTRNYPAAPRAYVWKAEKE
jgi:CRISPR-associated protein Csd1